MSDKELNGDVIEGQLISSSELVPSSINKLSEMSLAELQTKAKEAPARAKAINDILKASIAVTTLRDWVSMGGNPYCRNDGAIRVAELWGVKIVNVKMLPVERAHDKNGKYETYTYLADAIWGNVIMPIQGIASTRDRFLAADGKGGTKPFDEVNHLHIKQKALSNMKGNAGRQLFGLNSRTWDDLKEFGIEQGKAAKVDFKGKKSSSSPPPSQNKNSSGQKAKTKAFFAKCRDLLELGDYVDEIREYAVVAMGIRISEMTQADLDKYYGKLEKAGKDSLTEVFDKMKQGTKEVENEIDNPHADDLFGGKK